MIYLITGIPGSGKSLYAVSTLIPSLMKDTFTTEAGETITRRLVVDGIPDLALDHEAMSPTTVGDTTRTPDGGKGAAGSNITVANGGHGVGNWWEWCKPGDVIVIDECQRIWRPRAMGSKPPQMVTELETHRHYGVDFVLITQSPMLIDQNVRRLVGRHQHVRRLFGMKRALIYDWDGCQSDVHRVASASKTMWSYPTDAFKLYKSAELHTKQKQKFPIWVALPVLAIIGGIAVGPTAYASLSGAMTGKGLSSSAKSESNAVASVPVQAASVPVAASSAPVLPVAGIPDAPVLAGCIKSASRCTCLDTSGAAMPDDEELCKTHVSSAAGMPAKLPAFIPELNQASKDLVQGEQDGRTIAAMRNIRSLPNSGFY